MPISSLVAPDLPLQAVGLDGACGLFLHPVRRACDPGTGASWDGLAGRKVCLWYFRALAPRGTLTFSLSDSAPYFLQSPKLSCSLSLFLLKPALGTGTDLNVRSLSLKSLPTQGEVFFLRAPILFRSTL